MMKEESKLLKNWRIIYPLVIYFVLSNVVAFSGIILTAIIYTLQDPGANPYDVAELSTDAFMQQALLFTFLAALATLPILIFLFYMDKKRRKKLGTFVTYESAPLWGYGILVLLGGFACLGLNNLINLSGLGQIFQGYNEVAEMLYQSNLLFELLAVGIVVPIVEELLFRGLVYRRARDYYSFPMALILSATIFGIYHGNVVQGIYAFIFGIIFGYAYERFKSIWAPILMHVTANCLSVIISETEIFHPIYESQRLFLLFTSFSVVLVTCILLIIEQKISLKEVKA